MEYRGERKSPSESLPYRLAVVRIRRRTDPRSERSAGAALPRGHTVSSDVGNQFRVSHDGRRQPVLVLICQRVPDIRGKQRMPRARRRAKLGVELAADKPRVPRQLDQLSEHFGPGAGADFQTCRLQPRNVVIVDLIAMPM